MEIALFIVVCIAFCLALFSFVQAVRNLRRVRRGRW